MAESNLSLNKPMKTDTNAANTSLVLPSFDAFRNLKTAKRFAIDIGGSLAKLAYYSKVEGKDSTDTSTSSNKSFKLHHPHGRLNFVKFELKYMESCLDFIQSNICDSGEWLAEGPCVTGTGGGIHKYLDLIESKLGVQVNKTDEIECLTKGCVFVLRNIPDEAFLYDHSAYPQYCFQGVDQMSYPFLLVNIGSGVSFIKVESEKSFMRIGGTATGGGTFWGLGTLLTQAKTFDELLSLAAKGDHRNVDMLVGDITGLASSYVGLHKDLIASSFGKAARLSSEGKTFDKADLARSLLLTISNDIGQIAYLYAQQQNVNKIYFGGFFIRGHPLTMRTISFSVQFWSKDKIQALFLRHEGYIGAIGAFLKGTEQQEDPDDCSWGENYVGSSGLQSPKMASFLENYNRNMFDTLEFDQWSRPLTPCHLLHDPCTYFPDTVNLTQDSEARNYWLDCFINSSARYYKQALESQSDEPDAIKRANQYRDKYVSRLEELKTNPSAYGSLTVRSLLDLNSHCLQEFNFHDPFLKQKNEENTAALKELPALLNNINNLPWAERQIALGTGLLAGNVFDWGAKEVVDIMTKDGGLGFSEAKSKLQVRPWLVDDFDDWITRLQSGYTCAAIFCDNSGADIILGVIPFVIDLLDTDTHVILCANSRPTLNDVTYEELKSLVDCVSLDVPIVARCLRDHSLVVAESGQSSPCLDLRYIDCDLVNLMATMNTDLIIIEGMGRAVHTNYDAVFSCDSLRVAVLKNRWLARRLGGDMFNVMFKFVRGQKYTAIDDG